MAATDKPYRNQYRLDIVFGVSCLLLLLSTGWMMYDDHYRPWKRVQRTFRDVEEAMSLQQMLAKAPDDKLMGEVSELREAVTAKRQAVAEAKKGMPTRIREAEQARGQSAPESVDADAWLKKQGVQKAKLEAKYQDTKANYDSIVSLYNIAIDDRDNSPAGPHKDKLAKEAEEHKAEANKLDAELKHTQEELEKNERATAYALADQKKAEDDLAGTQDKLKKKTDEFDRLAKTAAQKRWKTGDWFRSLPILDAFASAYKIQQFSLDDLTIEYGSFKNVPRYDRCTTCHLGIERANFDPAALRALKLSPEQQVDLQAKHDAAVKFLKDRAKEAKDKLGQTPKESLGFDPDDLAGKVPSVELTDVQIKQYCAHPRLDLFVDSNSAHPAQKFGCTSCHAGQGSATEFSYAAHSPNDAAQRTHWEKLHDWEPSHDWEFPMLPARFVESGCLKCHHQVTDLVRQGSREEAPKLLKGYNLVRENGCFGCHEISGLKAGKAVGPDLRLEPSPPLEDLRPDEVAKLHSDPSNPPGTMRKVGPALRRLSEKVDENWVRKWVNMPRGFRPDTRMPHFYNLSNNRPDVLPADPNNKDYDQKDYPSAEVASIAHYLITESTRYVNHGDTYLKLQMAREQELLDLLARNQISDKQRIELIEVQRRIELAGDPRKEKRIKIADTILDFDRRPVPKDQVPQPGTDKDREEGRRLFTERGCLACHSHSGTEKAGGGLAAVAGEAQFGPNLSRLAAKLQGEKGRRWLLQWLLNPNVHFPRTRMPNMHLTPKEAGQVADWLLNQPVPKDEGFEAWNKDMPEPGKETLVDLARVYLKKAPNVNPLEVDDVLANGFSPDRLTDPQNPQRIAPEADEQVLTGPIDNDKLKYYIGKKAVSRLGCYGCHDIPGFEFAKPIGTPLNDWGKKDPARLAFEDIDAYVNQHYEVAELRDDPKDKTKPADSWTTVVTEGKKPPYEKFFAEALHAHLREGFLHQKLAEPRSYDFNRDVRWDDRLRMPQFKFSHPRQGKDERDEDFKVRAAQEEAQAREAVMTFILGLVAEPMHPRYLNNPNPDQLAEVKGRQVLDKFNCAGCHQVRPGVYQFKLDDADGGSRSLLEAAYKVVPRDKFATDHVFQNDNAWIPTRAPADRMTVHGTNPRELKTQAASGENVLAVRLSEAAAWQGRPHEEGDRLIGYGATGKAPADGYREALVLPAGNDVRIDPATLISRSDPYGGTFADLMIPYLLKKDLDRYKDADGAHEALPPPLAREGQKVQTEWLYNFLRDPTKIRPAAVLRMPKFNMSEDEARALVNYFAAADKTDNPAAGLTYPYTSVPEREEAYLHDQARRYWVRTGQGEGLKARVKKLEDDELPAAKKAAADAKDDATKKAAQDKAAELEAKLKVLKGLAAKPDEAARSLYWSDAYSLIATKGRSACLTCHRVGEVPASEEKGPPLDLAFQRLRPTWTEHWIANPRRLVTFDTTMPQNFPNGQADFQELFPGGSLEQLKAARDVLMNLPKVAETPENRSYRAATSGGK